MLDPRNARNHLRIRTALTTQLHGTARLTRVGNSPYLVDMDCMARVSIWGDSAVEKVFLKSLDANMMSNADS